MAREIRFVDVDRTSGLTFYALLWQPTTGAVRDVTNNTWDTYVTLDLGDYDHALTEHGTSGIYFANLPTGVTLTEEIEVEVYLREGASPAETDDLYGYGIMGAKRADTIAISGDSTAADNLEALLDGTGGVTLVASALTLTTPITANATQISGDATAADNLESALDGTGGVTITAAVTGNITGNLSGSVGSVTGNVGGNVVGSVASVTGNVAGNVTGSIGSLAAQAKADVNAEVDSALDTAIPASPTANSVNERIKTMDDADIPGRLPSALVGGRMDANLGAISTDSTAADNLEAALDGTGGVAVTATFTGNLTGSVGSLSTQAKADVNGEVVDVLTVDTFSELSSAPTFPATFLDMLKWLFTLGRHKRTTTSSSDKVLKADSSTTLGTSTISDDGTTFTRGKYT